MKVTPSKFKPFMLVTTVNEETKKETIKIIAGNTQCSPLEFDTEKDAEEYLASQPYEMFTNLYSIFKYYENENKKNVSKKI